LKEKVNNYGLAALVVGIMQLFFSKFKKNPNSDLEK
jgi:hypothetical protein